MQKSEPPARANLRRQIGNLFARFRPSVGRPDSSSAAGNTGQSQPRRVTSSALKVAGYGLVLMDNEGQVVWTREWDSGGVFEFRRRQRLCIFCAFTNRTQRETEISEYEIELMGEDGSVIERYGDSFGDSVIIPPGESKQFAAEWRM